MVSHVEKDMLMVGADVLRSVHMPLIYGEGRN